jgi:hypothetical protein
MINCCLFLRSTFLPPRRRSKQFWIDARCFTVTEKWICRIKTFYVLAVGGAPSYPEQFTGLMENLKHLLIYINGAVKEELFYFRSDKFGGTFEGENLERLQEFTRKIFQN